MTRRKFATSLLAAPVMPALAQQETARRTTGLPPIKITGLKVIPTSGGANYRWIFVKVLTSEPGLYGIGSASNNYSTYAVVAALEKHLAPFVIGKDPERIEDLWQSSHLRTYWRNGGVNNNVLSGLDMALWDIKGKRAGMPLYDLLGGRVRDAVPCYDHVGGASQEACVEAVHGAIERGFRFVRVQLGGYGGGGFLPAGNGERPEGGNQGIAFDEERFVDTIPRLFEFVRSKVGFEPKLLHDVHSHLSGSNAVEFCRRMQNLQMFFIEDVLPPEQLAWYKQIRQICSTPQAVGEIFSHPFEYIPLVTDRLIDFVRCRVSAIGGISPAKKLANFCEPFGVRTAFQEGGDNDPVNQVAAYHIDISSPAFGVQEENHFPDAAREMLPGTAEIRRGYLYGTGKPGLGIDIKESLAAKYPIKPMPDGSPYPLDRTLDGALVKP